MKSLVQCQRGVCSLKESWGELSPYLRNILLLLLGILKCCPGVTNQLPLFHDKSPPYPESFPAAVVRPALLSLSANSIPILQLHLCVCFSASLQCHLCPFSNLKPTVCQHPSLTPSAPSPFSQLGSGATFPFVKSRSFYSWGHTFDVVSILGVCVTSSSQLD